MKSPGEGNSRPQSRSRMLFKDTTQEWNEDLSQLARSTLIRMIYLSRKKGKGKTKDGKNVREFYSYIYPVNDFRKHCTSIHLWGGRCWQGITAAKMIFQQWYHIEHTLFLWDVIFLGTVNPKDIYLLFRKDRYETTDEENLGFKKWSLKILVNKIL